MDYLLSHSDFKGMDACRGLRAGCKGCPKSLKAVCSQRIALANLRPLFDLVDEADAAEEEKAKKENAG